MRLISITSFLLIAILVSCQKNKEDCMYNIQFSQIDTNLFISYKIDGKIYKYFQCYSFSSRTGLAPIISEDKADTILDYGCHFAFGSSKNAYEWSSAEVGITVWNSFKPRYFDAPLSLLIKDNYLFTFPKENPQISDSTYLNGITLKNQQTGYSIQSIMDYYKYDYDTIYNHVLKGSYFKITKVDVGCNNFHLIEGEFETSLMNNPKEGEKPIFINLKEGKIRFITY
ncbi:MAG: hypothetical protein Q7U54_10685 [Bacteroidales bacterium]|nr:hypothetical protein [Bacteroidales bacterium]